MKGTPVLAGVGEELKEEGDRGRYPCFRRGREGGFPCPGWGQGKELKGEWEGRNPCPGRDWEAMYPCPGWGRGNWQGRE